MDTLVTAFWIVVILVAIAVVGGPPGGGVRGKASGNGPIILPRGGSGTSKPRGNRA